MRPKPIRHASALACSAALTLALGGAMTGCVERSFARPPPAEDATPPSTAAPVELYDPAADGGSALENHLIGCVYRNSGDFYMEAGKKDGAIIRTQGFMRGTTPIALGWASSLLFAAYVVERFKSAIGQVDVAALTMGSGYGTLTGCALARTVQDCFRTGTNSDRTAANEGRFNFGGGHEQAYAIALGLGDFDNERLAAEYKRVLGPELGISFVRPEIASGIRMSPKDLGKFLKRVVSGELALRDHLGEKAVCTLPGVACPTALSRPEVPGAWHYSYGHWVEDDPAEDDDGSFSTNGELGVYAWINASKTLYGILAQEMPMARARTDSIECGRSVRRGLNLEDRVNDKPLPD